MIGYRPLAPQFITSAAGRDLGGSNRISLPKHLDVEQKDPSSLRNVGAKDHEVFFIVENRGASDVAVVDGSWALSGPPHPEDSLYVVESGDRAQIGPFSALAGPFHICTVSADAATPSDTVVRPHWRNLER